MSTVQSHRGKRRNLQLLGILLALCVISVVLGLSGSGSSGMEIDQRKFAVDPNTVISDVVLTRPDGKIELSYVDQTWMVNDKFPMDIRMRDTFFGILSSLEIRRPVAKSLEDSVVNLLRNTGVEVAITYLEEPVRSYTIGGDETSGVTFVMGEESVPFIVRLPGYQSYIAGIFSVPELDWKSRSVFNTDWLTLAGLTWDYVDESKNDIEFVPGDPLFTIENLPNIDSTRAMNYLEEIIFLQVDRYITSDEADAYQTEPYLVCTLRDRQLGEQTMVIHRPAEERQLALVVINDREYALIRWSRVRGYFIEPEDLIVSSN